MGRRKFYDNVTDFDGSAAGNSVKWFCVGLDQVSITIVRTDAASASTAVFGIEVSCNGTDWDTAVYVDPTTGTTTDVTQFGSVSNAAQLRTQIPVVSLRHIRVVVTTGHAATRFTISIYGEGEYETGGAGALVSSDSLIGRKA